MNYLKLYKKEQHGSSSSPFFSLQPLEFGGKCGATGLLWSLIRNQSSLFLAWCTTVSCPCGRCCFSLLQACASENILYKCFILHTVYLFISALSFPPKGRVRDVVSLWRGAGMQGRRNARTFFVFHRESGKGNTAPPSPPPPPLFHMPLQVHARWFVDWHLLLPSQRGCHKLNKLTLGCPLIRVH